MTDSEFNDKKLLVTLSNCEDIEDCATYIQKLMQIKEEMNQDPKKKVLKNMLTAFGNSDRFLILDCLREKDRCVCELEGILRKTQPAVSHHIRILENVHLIQGWKKGKFTHYSLVEKKFKEFLELWTEWSNSIKNWFGQ